jgi:hypothetical protein
VVLLLLCVDRFAALSFSGDVEKDFVGLGVVTKNDSQDVGYDSFFFLYLSSFFLVI